MGSSVKRCRICRLPCRFVAALPYVAAVAAAEQPGLKTCHSYCGCIVKRQEDEPLVSHNQLMAVVPFVDWWVRCCKLERDWSLYYCRVAPVGSKSETKPYRYNSRDIFACMTSSPLLGGASEVDIYFSLVTA